jgi:hypothetical protein
MNQRERDGAMAYGSGFDNDDPAMDLAGRMQEDQADHMTIDPDAFGEGPRGHLEVGDEVGRLISDDDGVFDTNPDATAVWAEDQDDLSAEEAAMHVVSEDGLSPGSPNDGYMP